MAPLLLHIFHLERVQPKKIRTIAADYIFSLSIIWIEDGCCIWRESRCYTVALRSKKRPPWVIPHADVGVLLRHGEFEQLFRAGLRQLVKGILFFLLTNAWLQRVRFLREHGRYISARTKAVGHCWACCYFSKKKKRQFSGEKRIFLMCGRSVFPSSATARPALVYLWKEKMT